MLWIGIRYRKNLAIRNNKNCREEQENNEHILSIDNYQTGTNSNTSITDNKYIFFNNTYNYLITVHYIIIII